MNRFYVPPLPNGESPSPDPDPLLEEFRDKTIKGGKAGDNSRAPEGFDTDPLPDDGLIPDLGQVDGSVDWGIDDAVI